MSSFSNKWLSYRNSDQRFFHIFFKALRGYYVWLRFTLLTWNFDSPNFFLGVSFFSPFLKAFFGNNGAPYLLLIWFKVLKYALRFCEKQCIAYKNEKYARVFDYLFQFIRELITGQLFFDNLLQICLPQFRQILTKISGKYGKSDLHQRCFSSLFKYFFLMRASIHVLPYSWFGTRTYFDMQLA